MKWIKRVLLFLLIGGFLFGGYQLYRLYQWKQEEKRRALYYEDIRDTASPTVEVLENVVSVGYRNETKSLHIYVPPSYDNDTIKRYPVLYMLDGASCFNDTISAPEWQIDEVINKADRHGHPGAIVICIPSAENRDAEYTPWRNEDNPDAHGAQFAQWVAQDLKNWVDSAYRTDPAPAATFIGGISRSGMMAYYMMMAHADIFGNAIIQSPSMWVDYDRLMDMEIKDNNMLLSKKVFVSVGEYEGNIMVPHAHDIYNKLKESGLPDDQLRYYIVPGEGHWNLTWRKSFAEAYPWLMSI